MKLSQLRYRIAITLVITIISLGLIPDSTWISYAQDLLPLPTSASNGDPTSEGLEPSDEKPTVEVFSDDFSNPENGLWNFGKKWSYVPFGDGYAFQVIKENKYATLNYASLLDVGAQVSFLASGFEPRLSLRSSAAGRYDVIVDSSGNITLYRGDTILQTAAVGIPLPDQWRTVRFSAIGNIIRVSIDGTEAIVVQDDNPLPAGQIALSANSLLTSSLDTSSSLIVDNFSLLIPVELPTTVTPITINTPIVSDDLTSFTTLLLSEDFEDNETQGMKLRNGWAIDKVLEPSVLKAENTTKSIKLASDTGESILISMRVQLIKGGFELQTHKSSHGAYRIQFKRNGIVYLYKDYALLGTAQVENFNPDQWHKVELTFINGMVQVYVDSSKLIAVNEVIPLSSGSVILKPLNSKSVILVDEITIKGSTEPSNISRSGGNPVDSLIQALTAANPSNQSQCNSQPVQIQLQSNTIYTLTSPIDATKPVDDRTGLPHIYCNIEIIGNGATIERGPTSSSKFRLFKVEAGGSLTLRNVVLQNGSARQGGSIHADKSDLKIFDSTLQNNKAEGNGDSIGGAIYVFQGRLTLDHSTITQNRSVSGSGTAGNGGGITIDGILFNSNEFHAISNSNIINNTADNSGGGVYILGGSQTKASFRISGTTIQANEATSGFGGGLYSYNTLLSYVTNSQILLNRAANGGVLL
jgi:hypothetical protein